MVNVMLKKRLLVRVLVVFVIIAGISVFVFIRNIPPSPENAIRKHQSISNYRVKREYSYWYITHYDHRELVDYFLQHPAENEDAQMIVIGLYANGEDQLEAQVVDIADLSDPNPPGYVERDARFVLENRP